MAVDETFRAYVLDQLSYVTPVESRPMFGGVGIWSEGHFFALIAGDRLYFKVDDSNRADYEARGSEKFGKMPYYTVPPEILDEPGDLRGWVEKSLTIARTKGSKKRR